MAKRHLEEEDTNGGQKYACKVFTDEKKFQASSSSKTEYVTRLSGEAYDKDKLKKVRTSINSSADINVWGYIGPFGKGNCF